MTEENPPVRSESMQKMLPIYSRSTLQEKMSDVSAIESFPFHDISLRVKRDALLTCTRSSRW